MPKPNLPDWEQLLSAAARLQRIIPDAVLVGDTAAALHAGHRFSHDADHVTRDLKTRFDDVLQELESVAGWRTARVKRPVLILGSLDGIETGVRQLIRAEPLETMRLDHQGAPLTVPTPAEILCIKAALILRRNATRDYLDFVALADRLGADGVTTALKNFDRLYPQPNLAASALQQLHAQLANPLPFDLDGQDLSQYRNLQKKWHRWETVKQVAAQTATALFDAMK
jgi:hypothetical protein